jgi:hypothetical protein
VFEFWVADHAPPKRLGDALDRDIIMRWAHAARGEDDIELAREREHLHGNDVDFIGNDRDLLDVYAQHAQLTQQVRGVDILHLARQNLIANDDDSRCLCHV